MRLLLVGRNLSAISAEYLKFVEYFHQIRVPCNRKAPQTASLCLTGKSNGMGPASAAHLGALYPSYYFIYSICDLWKANRSETAPARHRDIHELQVIWPSHINFFSVRTA